MTKPEFKELEITVTADEFQLILDGSSVVKKKVCRLWQDRLLKKNKSGKFKRFDQVRVKAHGKGEFTAPITTICKTSIGERPNTTPVFAIKFNIFKIRHLTKQEL